MKKNTPGIFPIVIVWILMNVLVLGGRSFLLNMGFDTDFLIVSNAFLFLISLAGYMLQRKGLQSPNPNAFVRAVYGSIMLKMFFTMIAVLIYAFMMRSKINKPGLFTAMGIYIIYTVVEVSTLMKVARKKNA